MRRFISLWLLFAFSASAAVATIQSILLSGEEWAEEKLRHQSISFEICPSPNPSLYYQPVIGIVTHPGDGASGRLSKSTNASNIPASYVKFVESAGARVIPLIYNDPWNVLSQKLQLVNGVLFTGGWAFEGLYFETIKKVFEVVLKSLFLIIFREIFILIRVLKRIFWHVVLIYYNWCQCSCSRFLNTVQ